jgi:hypothetical protein
VVQERFLLLRLNLHPCVLDYTSTIVSPCLGRRSNTLQKSGRHTSGPAKSFPTYWESSKCNGKTARRMCIQILHHTSLTFDLYKFYLEQVNQHYNLHRHEESGKCTWFGCFMNLSRIVSKTRRGMAPETHRFLQHVSLLFSAGNAFNFFCHFSDLC